MTPGIKPLVAGNWKMNGRKASAAEFESILEGADVALRDRVDIIVCPPATLLDRFARMRMGHEIRVGGQDCHADEDGPYTGDISAGMLADIGAEAVIVGHSERRALHGETDAAIRAKASAARRAGLIAIVCIGETSGERDAGETLAVVGRQLAGSVPDGASAADTVVAYEPVWAIGTGVTPSIGDVAAVHGAIRHGLRERFGAEGSRMRILYGGSVKPLNAAGLMAVPNVDGALVGGASLKAGDFLAVAGVYLTGVG